MSANTLPVSHVTSHWTCDDHFDQTAEMTFADIANVGTPICPDCGEDMALDSHVTTINHDDTAFLNVSRANIDSWFANLTNGTRLICVSNTYLPVRNGVAFEIVKAGRSSFDLRQTDSPDADSRIFLLRAPGRVGDVVSLTSDTMTWRIGEGDHTVTWQRLLGHR